MLCLISAVKQSDSLSLSLSLYIYIYIYTFFLIVLSIMVYHEILKVWEAFTHSFLK